MTPLDQHVLVAIDAIEHIAVSADATKRMEALETIGARLARELETAIPEAAAAAASEEA